MRGAENHLYLGRTLYQNTIKNANHCDKLVIGDFCLIKPASAWLNLTKSIPRLPRLRSAAGGSVRIGNDLTKIDFLLKNVDFDHFWPFLDLLDLKNGSGSKFRSFWW